MYIGKPCLSPEPEKKVEDLSLALLHCVTPQTSHNETDEPSGNSPTYSTMMITLKDF